MPREVREILVETSYVLERGAHTLCWDRCLSHQHKETQVSQNENSCYRSCVSKFMGAPDLVLGVIADVDRKNQLAQRQIHQE